MRSEPRPSTRAAAESLCPCPALTRLRGRLHPHWVGPRAPGTLEGGAVEPGAQLYAVAGARAQLQGLSLSPKRWLQHLRKGASGWSGPRGTALGRTRPLFDPNPTALNPGDSSKAPHWQKTRIPGGNWLERTLGRRASPCLAWYTPDTLTHLHTELLILTHTYDPSADIRYTHTDQGVVETPDTLRYS